MIVVEVDQVELDACPDCRGVWFDAQELEQLFELAGAPEHVRDLESHFERIPATRSRPRCPRCRRRMDPVRVRSVKEELVLDECPRGHGLWFDQGELGMFAAGLVGVESELLTRIREFLGHFAFVEKARGGGSGTASQTEGEDVT